jgi:hypothetical protein
MRKWVRISHNNASIVVQGVGHGLFRPTWSSPMADKQPYGCVLYFEFVYSKFECSTQCLRTRWWRGEDLWTHLIEPMCFSDKPGRIAGQVEGGIG